MIQNLNKFLVLLCFGLSSCIIVSDGECHDDYDCKEDRLCYYGECINSLDLLRQCEEPMHPCTCEPSPYSQAQFVPDDNCISGRTYALACDRCCASGYYNECAAWSWTTVCVCDLN